MLSCSETNIFPSLSFAYKKGKWKGLLCLFVRFNIICVCLWCSSVAVKNHLQQQLIRDTSHLLAKWPLSLTVECLVVLFKPTTCSLRSCITLLSLCVSVYACFLFSAHYCVWNFHHREERLRSGLLMVAPFVHPVQVTMHLFWRVLFLIFVPHGCRNLEICFQNLLMEFNFLARSQTHFICLFLYIQLGRDLQQYQSQAKQLFRKLNDQSPSRCTLEAGSMSFQWVWRELLQKPQLLK